VRDTKSVGIHNNSKIYETAMKATPTTESKRLVVLATSHGVGSSCNVKYWVRYIFNNLAMKDEIL